MSCAHLMLIKVDAEQWRAIAQKLYKCAFCGEIFSAELRLAPIQLKQESREQ